VFCDVERSALVLDLADAQRRTTLRTRAVMPVFYAGKPIPPPRVDTPVVYDWARYRPYGADRLRSSSGLGLRVRDAPTPLVPKADRLLQWSGRKVLSEPPQNGSVGEHCEWKEYSQSEG
jgi:hypothetical protein